MSMHFTRERASTQYTISGYSHDSITINQTEYRSSLIVAPEQLLTNIAASSIQQLSKETLQPILTFQPDLLLVSQPHNTGLLHPTIAVWLSQQGIGIEVMSHSAACRTFNVLASEGRKFCALFILDENSESK